MPCVCVDARRVQVSMRASVDAYRSYPMCLGQLLVNLSHVMKESDTKPCGLIWCSVLAWPHAPPRHALVLRPLVLAQS